MLWDAFNSLGNPSAAGAGGFTPISQQELAAWQSNYGVHFTPWELDSIRTLDRLAAHMSALHRQAQAQTQPAT